MLPLLYLTVSISFSLCYAEDKGKPSPTPFQDWNYLVYSQRWPITSCLQWEEESTKNTCFLPQNNNTWTVHGLWPSKYGAKGPFFCNSALHFDPDQLQPFMKDMLEFWPNVENNTQLNSFWKHEWSKHGTCAASLPVLNSVTNFFKKGLQLNREYNIAEMLSKANITPDSTGYNVSDVFYAIRGVTQKNPRIECVVDEKTKASLISEIRICFDKDFQLIHCNVTKASSGSEVLGNCDNNKNVMYFDKVPNNTVTEGNEESTIQKCLENLTYYRFQEQLLQIYAVVKFLMWFTL